MLLISALHLCALFTQVPREVREDIVEHRLRASDDARLHRPVRVGFRKRCLDFTVDRFLQRLLTIVVPRTGRNEMLAQTVDRITQWEALGLVRRPIDRRVVRRRIRATTQRDPLDQGRTEIRASPLSRPTRGREDGEIVVPVDTDGGNAEPVSPVRERRGRPTRRNLPEWRWPSGCSRC